jgi:hypothetical protein
MLQVQSKKTMLGFLQVTRKWPISKRMLHQCVCVLVPIKIANKHETKNSKTLDLNQFNPHINSRHFIAHKLMSNFKNIIAHWWWSRTCHLPIGGPRWLSHKTWESSYWVLIETWNWFCSLLFLCACWKVKSFFNLWIILLGGLIGSR